jgi:membrane dipeptidase
VLDDLDVVDLHAHAPGFIPRPWSSAYRMVNGRSMPPDIPVRDLATQGVDTAVVCAVGDPIATRWHRGTPWDAVDRQLRGAGDQPGSVDVVLGLEGGDAIGDDLSRIDVLASRGVRLVVLVHLADNQFGTTCLPWQHYVSRRLPVRRRTVGLTELGERAVRALQARGVVVDVSHSDSATVHGIVEVSGNTPVVASHSGARAVADFERFLTDDELRAISGTGGVVGLWPYRHRSKGVPDLDALAAHARHVATTVGVDHLAVGTDVNGVPAVARGYRGIPDIAAALMRAGFGRGDLAAVLGGNARRVLAAVA